MSSIRCIIKNFFMIESEMSQKERPADSFEDLSVPGDDYDLPGDEFAAGAQGAFRSPLQSAAAGYFHADDGD